MMSSGYDAMSTTFKMSVDRTELRLCFQRLFLYGTVWNCADHLAAARRNMEERVLSQLGFEIGHCANFCCLVVEDEMD